MAFDKIHLDQQVLESLTFYYMLTIHLSASGWGEEKSSQSLKEYMKDLKEGGYFYNNRAISLYSSAAWARIPSEFLERHDIPGNLHDNIRVIDTAVTFTTKML